MWIKSCLEEVQGAQDSPTLSSQFRSLGTGCLLPRCLIWNAGLRPGHLDVTVLPRGLRETGASPSPGADGPFHIP